MKWPKRPKRTRVVLGQPPPTETRALLGTVRQANRRQRIFNILLLLGMAAVVLAASLLWNRSDRQSTAITQLVSSLATTCNQVRTAALPTDVQADCARSQAGQSPPVVQQGVPGIPGATGATGAAGPAGPQGVPGEPGTSPPCLTTPSACVGATGVPGAPGTNGTNGTDGRSPPCLTTPAMCQGNDGRDGAPGAPGTDGQPPVGWTTTRADGSTETCTRAGDFDPANPRYACTVSSGQAGGGGGILGG